MSSPSDLPTRDVAVLGRTTIHLPVVDGHVDQDSEWCDVETDGVRRRLRFHDYAEIFKVPGLYEQLFYEELQCSSPTVVRDLIADVVTEHGQRASDLVVLDVGAGNGMVGEELVELGVAGVTGIDILPEAEMATARDRPGVYEDYRVVDLCNPDPTDDAELAARGFNALTCVAALGFGDIPPEAFACAFGYLSEGGLAVFTLKERFTQEREDESGFSKLLRELQESGRMRTLRCERYAHRLSVGGETLHYLVYAVEKLPGGRFTRTQTG